MSDRPSQPAGDPLNLFRLTDDGRREVIRRQAIVEAWEAARLVGKANGRREPEVTAAFLLYQSALGVELSRSTLYVWRRAYLKDGLKGLADLRSAPPAAKGTAPAAYGPFLDEVARLYRGPGLLSSSVCHELARRTAEEKGWAVPTYRHMLRFLTAHVRPALRRERGTD